MFLRIRLRERLNWTLRETARIAEIRSPMAVYSVGRAFPGGLGRLLAPYVDLTGYHRFLPKLASRGVFNLPGDILEIGAFVGVGTVKLAEIASRWRKKVYVVDLFDPSFDLTKCERGATMASLYRQTLKGLSQHEVFTRNVRAYSRHIVTIRGDSKAISLPVSLRLSFAFIDGNHDPSYVRNDFSLAWSRLVPGGVVGFDDYGHDLPAVTRCIDQIIRENQAGIRLTWIADPKQIFLQKEYIGLEVDRKRRHWLGGPKRRITLRQ